MSKVSARWVPQLLTMVHRQARIELCNHFINMINRDPEQFISRIVTGDEMWLYGYDPVTKANVDGMSSQRSISAGEATGCRSPISTKVVASVFYDGQGVIHIDYLNLGETVTTAHYITALSNLRQAFRHRRRGKLTRGILFHHDNAPTHRSRECASMNPFSTWVRNLTSPSVQPGFILCDLHLFPKSNDSWKVGDSRTSVSWNKLLKMLSPKSWQISSKKHFKRGAIEQRNAW